MRSSRARKMLRAVDALILLAICCLIGCERSSQDRDVGAGAPPVSAKPPGAQPSLPTTGFRLLDEYRVSRLPVFADDYGELGRYREANAKLPPPHKNENRVVFFGDSITERWELEQYFPGKPYVNRGINGQTTPQMLVRFRQDVLDLYPKVVVVLAGSNDIAGITGPERNEDIEADYASFAQLARANGVRMVFASILPVNDYPPLSKDYFAQRPMQRIRDLNDWLRNYCASNHIVYLDYFSVMLDERGLLKRELALDDGLHPSDAGYRVMAPLAEAAIGAALKAKPRPH